MQSILEGTKLRRNVATAEGVISASSASSSNVSPKKDGPMNVLENLFINRASLLDLKQLATEHSHSTNLTGFYHFYWISLSFFVATTLFVNWVDHGYLLSGVLFNICFKDPVGVFIGEALFLLVAILSGLCIFVPYTWMCPFRNILPYSILIVGIFYGFHRNWSGLQRAIYFLHSLSVFMKIYAFLYHHRFIRISLDQLKVKLCHYLYFIFAPTMLYSESYPKTERIRKSVVFERLLGIALCGIAMYIVVETYIYPPVQSLIALRFSYTSSNFITGLLYAYSKLILPCNAFFLLGFFFVFEYWCNLFAELTCFADRHFYSDWWNGVSFYDFSTRWNIPVHKFLQKYIYQHLITETKVSKSNARIITFLFSSVFHELVMFVMMGPNKYIFTYLFVYQMLQIPLISIVVSSGWAKKNQNLANWVFWIMLVLGIPVVVVSYSLFVQ